MEVNPAEKKMPASDGEPACEESSEAAKIPGPSMDIITPAASQKRKDYLCWEDYFMALAFLTAQRSKDPVTQVGAIIVNVINRIVGMGYNGFPMGISDDEFPWGKSDIGNPFADKNFYVCHAELNAVLNKNSASIKGCRIYITHFPCSICCKLIVQSEIKEVIYAIDKKSKLDNNVASKRMLLAAGIHYRKFKPTQQKVLIDFGPLFNS